MRIELVKVLNERAISKKHYPDFFLYVSESPDEYQPSVKVEKIKRYLKLEIHEWFISLNAEYSLECNINFKKNSSGSWYIKIPNKNIATLFKLTWC
jgi:hypothetical protein